MYSQESNEIRSSKVVLLYFGIFFIYGICAQLTNINSSTLIFSDKS